MSQTLTNRVKAIMNDPGTGEQVQIVELNNGFAKLDNDFRPAAKIENSVVQNVTNGATQKMVFDSTIYDSYAARAEGAMADVSNDKIIIRKTGLYLVSASAQWTNNAVGYRSLGIRRAAGAALIKRITQDANAVAGLDTSQTLTDVVLLNSGDEIEVTVLQTSGAGLNLDPTIAGANEACSLAVIWFGSVVEV